MKKTNAARIMDRKQLPYRLIEYEVDETDLSAAHVAALACLPPEMVFKTLVVKGDRNGIFVCVIPGESELDLKAAAGCSGNKKAEMARLRDVFDLTGYIRGGVSPVGLKKDYPVFIDEMAFAFDEISVSAGLRGMQMAVSPDNLLQAVSGRRCELIK